MTVSNEKTDKKQKILFEEIDFVGSDKMIILNKSKLLEMINEASKQVSITSLRNVIFTLREQLSTFKADKKGLLNIAANGDTVQINQKYLFGELRQIIETRTLDRCKYYLHSLAKAIAEQKTKISLLKDWIYGSRKKN